MSTPEIYYFSSFHLDASAPQLWRGTEPVELRPKTLSVLVYLVKNQGRTVSANELLQGNWPEVAVSPGTVKISIHEIREALEDKQKPAQFVETVHRQGYRFIAPNNPPDDSVPSPLFVGRTTELSQLEHWLEKALSGRRQLVFLSGEPGIGKTTVVQKFLDQVKTSGKAWTSLGQCLEYYGEGEAYLPVLEALELLSQDHVDANIPAIFRQYAPAWLTCLPALLPPQERPALQQQTLGTTRERMLREGGAALEVLTARQALVLVLEDLHWSDPSTLDLLSYVTRGTKPARLLIIGTYRPAEMLSGNPPLKALIQGLELRKQSQQLPLEFLSKADVEQYLALRFDGAEPPTSSLESTADFVHQRTKGNPLFMVNIVSTLKQSVHKRQENGTSTGDSPLRDVPSDVQQLIKQQYGRLDPDEQELLEVASVAGMSFSAAAVATGLGKPIEAVESRCARLAQYTLFLQSANEESWPDGTIATRYEFIHALYQEVLYNQLTAARRAALHQRIGRRLEKAYGEHAAEKAAELATHFERGQLDEKAIHYLQLAAQNSMSRSAHHEAIQHLTKALGLLHHRPDRTKRIQQELSLNLDLSVPLIAATGYASSEVECVHMHAHQLSIRTRNRELRARTLFGLCELHLVRGNILAGCEQAQELLRHARRIRSQEAQLHAHSLLSSAFYFQGKLNEAKSHSEAACDIYDWHKHSPSVSGTPHDPGVYCLGGLSCFAWHLGSPDQAVQNVHETLALAHKFPSPNNLGLAYSFAMEVFQFRREPERVRDKAEMMITLALEYGFPFWLAEGQIMKGWALAQQGKETEGIALIEQGLAAWQNTGAGINATNFRALLAESYERVGRVKDGLKTLQEALKIGRKTGERFYEAELQRLTGELMQLKAGKNPKEQLANDAEECFRKAIRLARHRKAKSLELRAEVSLARLLHTQGKGNLAQRRLKKIHDWFTEGFNTPDLKEAKVLLDELS